MVVYNPLKGEDAHYLPELEKFDIGVVDAEKEDEPNMVDHPVFFCPFCGTKLQSPDEVDAKVGGQTN